MQPAVCRTPLQLTSYMLPPLPVCSYTRFAAYLQPAYYADSIVKKQLHKFLLPFKRAIWNYFGETVPPLIAAPGALTLG